MIHTPAPASRPRRKQGVPTDKPLGEGHGGICFAPRVPVLVSALPGRLEVPLAVQEMLKLSSPLPPPPPPPGP
jgi:hypothetical protein